MLVARKSTWSGVQVVEILVGRDSTSAALRFCMSAKNLLKIFWGRMKISSTGSTHIRHPICLGIAVDVRGGRLRRSAIVAQLSCGTTCLITREQERIGNHHILIPASRKYYDLGDIVRGERYATTALH